MVKKKVILDEKKMTSSRLSKSEEVLLNHYASSELAGGLILGRKARVCEDVKLVKSLLRHSKEGPSP